MRKNRLIISRVFSSMFLMLILSSCSGGSDYGTDGGFVSDKSQGVNAFNYAKETNPPGSLAYQQFTAGSTALSDGGSIAGSGSGTQSGGSDSGTLGGSGSSAATSSSNPTPTPPPGTNCGFGNVACGGNPTPTPTPVASTPTPEPTPVVVVPTPTPTATPNPPGLLCDSSFVVDVKKDVSLSYSYVNVSAPFPALHLQLSSDQNDGVAIGSIAMVGDMTAKFTAPQNAANEIVVTVTATSANVSIPACVTTLHIPKSGDIGVEDDGEIDGLVLNVYQLTNGWPKINDFAGAPAVQTVVSGNLDIPNHPFAEGFPGVRDLIEWFGIRFRGELIIPADGLYKFQLTSDDGSNLYIDDNKIIDNDGVHAVKSVQGSVTLRHGLHHIRVDYYQGPRYFIGLQLLWKKPGDAKFVIVPTESFTRPLN